MRWCRFILDKEVTYGIVTGDSVVPVTGTPFTTYTETSTLLPIHSISLLVPVLPQTFYAAGTNYMDHVRRMAEMTGKSINPPKAADIGYRANNALVAHNEPIVIPKDASEKVQYEGELVVVIGKPTRNIKAEQVKDHILGYTIGNDVSERTWQAQDRTLWRAKNSDTFKPMGPWIETDVELDTMDTVVRVNGEELQNFKTNNMIFDVPTYISRMSKYMTLHPGDVIWMGTDGVGTNLKPGDTVEVELTGIGILSNPVVVER